MGVPAFLHGNTQNQFTTISVTDAAPGTDIDNVFEPIEDTYWQPLTTNTQTIEYHPGAVSFVGTPFAAFAGEGFDSATLEVRGSTDGFVSSNVQLLAPTGQNGTDSAWWVDVVNATYQDYRFIFSNFDSDFLISYFSFGTYLDLPYLAEDWDGNSSDPDGDFLVSGAGYLVGSVVHAVYRDLPIRFGSVTSISNFLAWREACIDAKQGFFFVPDIDTTEVYFGYVKEGFKAPYKNGMYEIAPMTFKARL